MDQIREATERLLNLLIALRSAPGWVDRETLRRSIAGYADLSDSAFDRRFSRDKDALRAMGIEISTTDWDDPTSGQSLYGYRITNEDYALPAIDFTPAEAAALSVAADWWRSSPLAAPAGRALHKLAGLAREAEDESADPGDGAAPEVVSKFGAAPEAVGTSDADPAVRPLPEFWAGEVAAAIAATTDRQAVRFEYRKPSGETSVRTVEPYRLLARGNRVYLVGRDVDRDGVRTFRLSRVLSRIRPAARRRAGDYSVPEDFDAGAAFAPQAEAGHPQQASIAIAPGRAEPLRSEGVLTGSTARGWDTYRIDFEDAELFAATLAEFGPSVRVLAPRQLAAAHESHMRTTLSVLTGLIDQADAEDPLTDADSPQPTPDDGQPGPGDRHMTQDDGHTTPNDRQAAAAEAMDGQSELSARTARSRRRGRGTGRRED